MIHLTVQRFALAHEIAHFLVDYLEPRSKAIETLWERDVRRSSRWPIGSATIQRASKWGLEGCTPLGTVLLISWSAAPQVLCGASRSSTAEDRADRLALELLAPRSCRPRDASRLLAFAGEDTDGCVPPWHETLVHKFGLAGGGGAKSYSHMLAMRLPDAPFVPRLVQVATRVEVRGIGREELGMDEITETRARRMLSTGPRRRTVRSIGPEADPARVDGR